MMATARRNIGSLQRALDILDSFDEQMPALGITELSEMLGLHKSTVAGQVYTLERNGYLEQEPVTRKYRLGLKLVERAFTMLDQLDVRAVALPHLQELRDWCDESVFLAVRDGGHVVYIEQLLSSQPLGMRAKLGYRAPVQTTALGKAILSALPQADVEQLVSEYGLPEMTPNSIRHAAQFAKELDRTRERGYSVDDEENEPGVRCVGAPILDHTGSPTAALSLSAPLQRMPSTSIPDIGQRVADTAWRISRSLGHGFPAKSRVVTGSSGH
jgi:IclR family acetate operon transcriptional repressor